MAIHKVLCSRYRGRTQGRVAEVGTSHNGRFVPIGTGLPTTVEGADGGTGSLNPSSLKMRNRVCEFEGDLYCVQRQDIYKWNKTTEEWELDHAAGAKYVSGFSYGDAMSAGLYVAAQGGINYMYHLWATAVPGTWRSVRKQGPLSGNGQYEAEIEHTTPFTSFNNANTGVSESLVYGGILDIVEYNSKVYGITTAAQNGSAESLNSIFTFDLMNQTMGSIALPSFNAGNNRWGQQVSFAAYKDRIFLLAPQGTTGGDTTINEIEYSIIELVGSTTITRLNLDTGTGAQRSVNTFNSSTSQGLLFSDGDYLYAAPLTNDSVNEGYKLHQIETSGQGLVDLGEITSGVLPDEMARGTQRVDQGLTSAQTTARALSYVQVDASGNDEIIIAHTNLAYGGNPYSFWKWEGPSTPMTFLGRGHGAEVALPSMKQGGGAYLWSEHKPFQVQIEDIQPSPVPGNIRLFYRLVGGSGEPASIRFLYNNQQQTANTFATLASVTSPAVSSGTAQMVLGGWEVTGVVADSGIVYQIDWRAELDGIVVGDNYVINPVAKIGALINT